MVIAKCRSIYEAQYSDITGCRYNKSNVISKLYAGSYDYIYLACGIFFFFYIANECWEVYHKTNIYTSFCEETSHDDSWGEANAGAGEGEEA